MKLNINNKNYFKVAVFHLLILVVGFVFTTAVFVQTASSSEVPPELVSLARDLGCNSKEDCETAFNDDLKRGVDLAQKYQIYDEETQKLAQTFKAEVLSQLTNAANFEEEIIKIAEGLIKSKPTLARSLNLEQQDVTGARTIINEVNSQGVNLKICSQSAESLTRGQLIACVNATRNLSEDKTVVKNYISEGRLDGADESDAMIRLQQALDRGEYSQLGTKDPEELGNVCLRPGSPPQCDEIAAKFFGQDGVKYLTQARQQVSSVAKKYLAQSESFVLTTPDGQTITGEEAIRNKCDSAFDSGDIQVAKACGDLAVRNGFASEEEVQEGLDFLQSFKGKNIDFNECRNNPESCKQFIPQDRRGEFDAMQEMQKIMTEEIGFSPERCQEGVTNPEIGESCYKGSQRALPRLEILAQKSPQIRRIINDIRGHIEGNEKVFEKRQEFQQTFQSQQGGPGGCKSSQECSTYCSNPTNGPECIAFGAKHQVFSGQEAVSRFQEFQGINENAPKFSGQQGSFPGFQPPGQDGFPPGQQPGFTQPGPGFNQPPGIGYNQNGPSPECFSAIQSGDFAKAKEVCVVNLSTSQPIVDPGLNRICPQVMSVNSCPEGQELVASGTQECPYNYCRPVSDSTNRTCPAGQRWDGTSCITSNYSNDPSTGCVQAGGTWDSTKNPPCQMPGTTSCQFGNYWNGTSCVADDNKGTETSCAQVGGTWDAITSYCKMKIPGQPPPIDCPSGQCQPPPSGCQSGQYWNGTACVTNTQPTGQKTQTWNSLGLSSQIKTDADPARIESLKQACANVRSGSSIWMTGAGDSASPDFGMPNPEKCQRAASCSTTQYFDGSNCVAGTSGGSGCSYGQYWNGTACVASTTTGGTGCGSGTAQASQSACLAISGCTWFNGACSPANSGNTTCSSGQYWDGRSCIGMPQSSSDDCRRAGGTWDGTACSGGTGSNTTAGSNTTTCSGGQYWNGTSCVTSNSGTACTSGQYWNGTACVTSGSGSGSACSSGQYWNGSACVSSSTNTTACPSGYHMGANNACEPDMSPEAGCAKVGGTWENNSCKMPTSSVPPYFALASAVDAVVSLLVGIVKFFSP